MKGTAIKNISKSRDKIVSNHGLVSTYLRTYHRTEEFIIALANYVVSWGVRITDRPDIFLLTFYNRWHQLSIEFLCLFPLEVIVMPHLLKLIST